MRLKARLKQFEQMSTISFIIRIPTLSAIEGSRELKASNQAAVIEGEIQLGGLFPVHVKAEGTAEQCGQINEQRGIQVRRQEREREREKKRE